MKEAWTYHLRHPADYERDTENGHEACERDFFRRWHVVVGDVSAVREDTCGAATTTGKGAGTVRIPTDPPAQDLAAGATAAQVTQDSDDCQVAHHYAHTQQSTCRKTLHTLFRCSSSGEVKERVELYLFFPSAPSWTVLGWTLVAAVLSLPDRFWAYTGWSRGKLNILGGDIGCCERMRKRAIAVEGYRTTRLAWA